MTPADLPMDPAENPTGDSTGNPTGESTVTIEWDDFERVELRVGTITTVVPNAKARRPAYVLTVDLGPLGIRTSSAQLTEHYSAVELIGRQVLCVCNFAPKRVAGIKS